MANRLVGNVWIIDTVGALSTQPSTGRSNLKVRSVGFYAIDTTAAVNLAMVANTTNIIFPLRTSISTPNFNVFEVSGVLVDELTAITVTAGTAYLYLA